MKEERFETARKWAGILGCVIFGIAILITTYMICHNMGQVEGIDFGPGQYYYTDIPNWPKYFSGNYYDCPVPMSFLIALFFIWGYIMFRFWAFLDDKL